MTFWENGKDEQGENSLNTFCNNNINKYSHENHHIRFDNFNVHCFADPMIIIII